MSTLLVTLLSALPTEAGRRDRRPIEQPPQFRRNNDKIVAKRHLHGMVEMPVSEEIELIEQPHEFEVLEEVDPAFFQLPRYSSLVSEGPALGHIHHPSIKKTKFVEVSSIDDGHHHLFGQIQVLPPVEQRRKGKLNGGGRKSKPRVEIFHTQEQIETIDPEELEITQMPMNGYAGYEEQRQADRLRDSRPSQGHTNGAPRSAKLRGGRLVAGGRAEIIEEAQLITPEDRLLLASLNAGHHHGGRIVMDDHGSLILAPSPKLVEFPAIPRNQATRSNPLVSFNGQLNRDPFVWLA